MDRRRRQYQIEGLETRNLLSTIHGPQTAIVSALRVKTVTLSGLFSGSFGPNSSGNIDISAGGNVSAVGSVYLVGGINGNILTQKPGSRFTGSFSVFTNSGNANVANISMTGKVPKSPSKPISVSLSGNGAPGLLPHSLKGSAIIKITTLNADGTGQFTMTFKTTGRL
jgi:hypothetical protein